MEWLQNMNNAIAYIEDNLNGDIAIEKAAQIACCSQYYFQRMFSYIIGIPLSEYIRRRRLTKAAFDLQSGDKVIDVAMRYGYDSPTAFNRAFQAMHGVSPSVAQRQDTILKAFSRVSFQMTIKGVEDMDYRIVEKEGFRVVGIRTKIGTDVDANAQIIMPFWKESAEAGRLAPIAALINGEFPALLGVSTMDDLGENNYYCICAATDKPIPEGMFEVNIPKLTWAIFPGQGKPDSIGALFKRIFSEWLPTSGYEWAAQIDMEVYLNADFENMKYEVWMPVKKS